MAGQGINILPGVLKRASELRVLFDGICKFTPESFKLLYEAFRIFIVIEFDLALVPLDGPIESAAAIANSLFLAEFMEYLLPDCSPNALIRRLIVHPEILPPILLWKQNMPTSLAYNLQNSVQLLDESDMEDRQMEPDVPEVSWARGDFQTASIASLFCICVYGNPHFPIKRPEWHRAVGVGDIHVTVDRFHMSNLREVL
mmetsp:Transcript_12610/g.31011  ORF Transcript_12610/g.31011 Transcript_12610/m.31011 type:complete len:200 (+) Transcript_12610:3870-4469(+)